MAAFYHLVHLNHYWNTLNDDDAAADTATGKIIWTAYVHSRCDMVSDNLGNYVA